MPEIMMVNLYDLRCGDVIVDEQGRKHLIEEIRDFAGIDELNPENVPETGRVVVTDTYPDGREIVPDPKVPVPVRFRVIRS